MARYDDSWITKIIFFVVFCLCTEAIVNAAENNDSLTACQHLRQAESRRAKSLEDIGTRVRIPKCSNLGDFERVQCSNELNGTECWCVDEYGIEVAGTRKDNEDDVNCDKINECPASSCRMYCPAGFSRDARSGCPICQCRDPCDGVVCPGGLACQPQEVNCKTEPCPPIPTCKRARSLSDLCPAGHPLTITDTVRPFLCGNDAGKPTCPPLFKCLVQSGNDYGVCCPASIGYEKAGECPNINDIRSSQSTGVLCGTPCAQDLDCPQMEKCCISNGCGSNCQQPHNITTCHQARMLSEILSVNEREGRGYIPQCNGPSGTFSEKQCSRNGLVCWCVDQQNGNKIKASMGAAATVSCKGIIKNSIRSQGRSVDVSQKCDQNICASVCEYGFKIDHNNCPTCECSEPCDGFVCPIGSRCDVAKDPECRSGSALCASEPVCKPEFVYSNPCAIGTPLVDNVTSEIMYCRQESTESRAFQSRSFFDSDPLEASGRVMTNYITCPANYDCMKLHKESQRVCCPKPEKAAVPENTERQQSMCEYLRDFSDRMEGTEEGMVLALTTPTCNKDGNYEPAMCIKKTIMVTRAEQKRILEEKNVRQMKMMFDAPQRSERLSTKRQKRNAENLKLYKVVEENPNIDSRDSSVQLDIKSIIKYLRQNILAHPDNSEANYMAEILSRKLLNQVVQERSAKVIDYSGSNLQNLDPDNHKNNIEKTKPIASSKEDVIPNMSNEMVEVIVDECWCVDGFGTEIPSSRGLNVTQKSCQTLRESLDCLDLTCRMGCDYGFILDPITKCPSCECRDPCDSITCQDNQECRSVEVSCEGEYCPPVPACLPRKPGQCPFLVPPGTEGSNIDTCEYDCRSDFHCEGNKRCCSNGCGTQCVEPQLKTACQHLQTIQLHQASELGVPARQKYIAQCDAKDGSWLKMQCGPGNVCWCVDDSGNELSGTRKANAEINCDQITRNDCPLYKCQSCEHGYLVDENGCRTCTCRDPCNDIMCPRGEQCQLVKVECIDEPCPKMPICVPEGDSVCSEGNPLKLNKRDVVCGPQNDADICPSTHSCHLDMESRKGVCCVKTRDVCFESIDSTCIGAENDTKNVSKWRFSPKQNKCVRLTVAKSCQTKNVFDSENACSSVCPVLSQCERLRLRNSLAAKRAGQPLAWFQPRCDPETGFWDPVQCLGKTSTEVTPTTNSVGRAMPSKGKDDQSNGVGVCWCADKKGAPVKGTLTRGIEPMCNHRQARRRMLMNGGVQDPVMEELIKQLTIMSDEENVIENDLEASITDTIITTTETVTERILEIANSVFEEKRESSNKLITTMSRCNAMKLSESFPVTCDTSGSFEPTQCNDALCWCIDAAGNQLPLTGTFAKGSSKCVFTPIDLVSIELHMPNPQKKSFKNLYDIIKNELVKILGDSPDNLRVHENIDGTVSLKFDLTDSNKIDTAFAIEEMVKQNNLILVNGELMPDLTLSRFVHRSSNLPMPQSTSLIPESTFQTIIFILATTSAFLVSIFVVFIMLKRGKNKMKNYNTNKTVGMGDKFLDYSSPIFVLSANDKISRKET